MEKRIVKITVSDAELSAKTLRDLLNLAEAFARDHGGAVYLRPVLDQDFFVENSIVVELPDNA